MARKLLSLVALACLIATLAAPGMAEAGPGHLKRRASPGLLAPLGDCPREDAVEAPVKVQLGAMTCLVEFARQRMGLAPLSASYELDLSADAKAGDVLRCDAFSHFACGRDFTFWMRRFGFLSSKCWRIGENLAWGTEDGASARIVFRALIHSREHRRNILGEYTELGLGLRVGRLGEHSGAHVWTQHFGSHC